jgi:hypothetical protein
MATLAMKYFNLLFLGLFALPLQASINICEEKIGMGINQGEVVSCVAGINVRFGYSALNKRASWAAYTVNSEVHNSYITKTGWYSNVSSVSLNEQVLPRSYLDKGYDLAYLVAPYLTNELSGSESLNNMSNMFPINSSDWRGKFGDFIWWINQNERLLAVRKGEYKVVTGLHYPTAGAVSPTHIYKIYIHPEYNATLSLFLPITSRVNSNIEKYITSIDCIEKRTGLNLTIGLKAEDESDMENKKARSFEVWSIKDGRGEEDLLCDI